MEHFPTFHQSCLFVWEIKWQTKKKGCPPCYVHSVILRPLCYITSTLLHNRVDISEWTASNISIKHLTLRNWLKHLKGELKAHIHISLYESNTLQE